MYIQEVTLQRQHIRLEPLRLAHGPGLIAAASADPELYRWTLVPHDEAQARQYIQTALDWQAAGTALPFATVRAADGQVLGSTRFFGIEAWNWPPEHARHGRSAPDVCEIGYTWLAREAIRTPANTEAKLLMLTQAFETWGLLRVCFNTDARNTRSQAALERLGARREGVLRAHRLAFDHTVRDSVRYSILAEEWPAVKQGLVEKLGRSEGNGS